LIAEVWQKGAALLAAEATAEDLAAKRATLTNSIATLRSWADDADAAVDSWDAWTTAQRFAALKITLMRISTLLDRMADTIETR
jgi:hypothetical protein